MFSVFITIHIIISIFLITTILLQRTSADGLSGLGGTNPTNLLSGRTTANFLTRTTAILAFLFMANSLFLAKMATKPQDEFGALIEQQSKSPSIPSSSAPDLTKGSSNKTESPAKPVVPIAQ
jgi:preprotein translocase subunit SecG